MVRQSLPGGYIADPRGEVRRRLLDFGLRDRVHSGHRIAITAGSRGMGGFLDLLAGAADAVRAAGGEPEIVPAMGSHGGATPEGQAEILRLLGVSDDTVGAPVRATMDTVTTGAAPNGAVAHLDRIASEADGIIVLGRVKTHPESATGLASGLLKMITAGLGKQRGAQQAHPDAPLAGQCARRRHGRFHHRTAHASLRSRRDLHQPAHRDRAGRRH
jgi:hypothetical protein